MAPNGMYIHLYLHKDISFQYILDLMNIYFIFILRRLEFKKSHIDKVKYSVEQLSFKLSFLALH